MKTNVIDELKKINCRTLRTEILPNIHALQPPLTVLCMDLRCHKQSSLCSRFLERPKVLSIGLQKQRGVLRPLKTSTLCADAIAHVKIYIVNISRTPSDSRL